MARQILWKKTLHAPWYFVSRTQGREIWTQVLPSLICFYLNSSFSFFREKALSPCSENYTTGPFQSPPLSCPVSSAVLHISQKRRPTPIQVNSDGPRACSRESRAEMQTFRRAAFTRRRQEHTHSRDSAPRQNRRATRQHTPGHTPHGHTWEHTCYPQIPPPAVHDARVTRSVGPQPLPARNWPAVGWARHSRRPPRCVIRARRRRSAGWGLKCWQLQSYSRRSCGCERPGRERAAGGCWGRERRDRCVVARSPDPAQLPPAARRFARLGARSLSRAPSGFPPELWARLVPAWESSSFSPRDSGLRQGFPRAGVKSLWAQSPRTPEGDVEALTLALRLQGYAESSWCRGQSHDRWPLIELSTHWASDTVPGALGVLCRTPATQEVRFIISCPFARWGNQGMGINQLV